MKSPEQIQTGIFNFSEEEEPFPDLQRLDEGVGSAGLPYVVGDRFEINDKIYGENGRETNSVVYSATDLDTHSDDPNVAVKIFVKENNQKYEQKNRSWLRNTFEIRVTDALEHRPHVISSLGSGVILLANNHTVEAYRYMATPLFSEGTLIDFVKNNPYDEKVYKKIISDMAKGVADLHEEGLVSRDIKPQNVLVNENRKGNYEASIADFGIAVPRDGVIQNAPVIAKVDLEQVVENIVKHEEETQISPGSLPFAAPEQAGGSIDPALDSFALGRTALYALGALNQLDLSKKAYTKDELGNISLTQPPERLIPRVPAPRRLVSILRQTQNLDPKKRPSAEQIAEAAA